MDAVAKFSRFAWSVGTVACLALVPTGALAQDSEDQPEGAIAAARYAITFQVGYGGVSSDVLSGADLNGQPMDGTSFGGATGGFGFMYRAAENLFLGLDMGAYVIGPGGTSALVWVSRETGEVLGPVNFIEDTGYHVTLLASLPIESGGPLSLRLEGGFGVAGIISEQLPEAVDGVEPVLVARFRPSIQVSGGRAELGETGITIDPYFAVIKNLGDTGMLSFSGGIGMSILLGSLGTG